LNNTKGYGDAKNDRSAHAMGQEKDRPEDSMRGSIIKETHVPLDWAALAILMLGASLLSAFFCTLILLMFACVYLPHAFRSDDQVAKERRAAIRNLASKMKERGEKFRSTVSNESDESNAQQSNVLLSRI
jgi:hypothetical protein